MQRVSLVVLLLAGPMLAQQASPEPGLKQIGVVRALGRPIPGATITATQGDRKVVTTTDESGRYELDGLAPGDWIIRVEMIAFTPVSREGIARDLAPPLEFNLELQTAKAVAKVEPAPAKASEAAKPTAPTDKPATRPATAANSNSSDRPQRGRGPQQQRGQGQQAGDGFRNLNVNQTADAEMLAQMGGPQTDGANPDSAGDAFAMNGTLTNGLQMAQQQ